MIKLIYQISLSQKNKIVIISYFILLITIFIMPLPFRESKLDLFINRIAYFNQYQEITLELLKLIIPIYLLLILENHDNKFLNSLTTYFSRFKIINNKLFFYLYINILNYLLIVLVYYLVPFVFKFNFITDNNYFIKALPLLFDSLIITLLILLLNRSKQKFYAYIIIAIYLLLNFLYAYNLTIAIYYLLPFYSNYFMNYQNTYIYQLCYLLLLLILTYCRYLREDFQ